MLHRFTFKFTLVFSIIIGIICYYRLRVEPKVTGDLCRMLSLPKVHETYEQEIEQQMQKQYGIKVQNIETYNGKDTCDYEILSIGDSFTEAFNCGHISYSALLGQLSGKTAARMSGNLQDFVKLVNNNLLKPDTRVVVESVERAAISRFISVDFSASVDLLDLQESQQSFENKANTTRFSCMSRTCIWLRSVLHLGPKPAARQLKLSAPMFTGDENSNLLLYYKDDIVFGEYDQSSANTIKENINRAKQMADSAGIELLVVVAADKYDFYYSWIINPPTSPNPTLDFFPRDSAYFVDTKSLLLPYAEQGLKDIYKCSDTHWSTIGSYIVANEILKRFGLEKINKVELKESH